MRAPKLLRQLGIPYLFLLPQLILVGLFSFYPLFYNLMISFQEFGFDGNQFVGLSNYCDLYADPVFWRTFANTLYYSIGTVPLSIGLALAAAIGLNQPIRGKVAFRTIYLFPNLLSWVVIGLIWKLMYSVNYGIFNQILNFFGLKSIPWLQDPALTIPSIIIASVWHDLGYYMVIFLAGLQSIPPACYEAAKIDGANAWNQFRRITLPLLRPILFVVLVLAVINSFKIFDQIFVMTSGGPGQASLMLMNYIIQLTTVELRMGYASAVSVVLFLVILGLTVIQRKLFNDHGMEG
jgi:ABC-type sugar transport system permease subunit